MIDLIPMFYGIPVAEIKRDIKDGKFILKSQGNINRNINAQTVIVYGDIKGNIKADQVVVINGKATGNIHADTVMGLKDKKTEETCYFCKFFKPSDSPYTGYCEKRGISVIKCSFYQKKENPAK